MNTEIYGNIMWIKPLCMCFSSYGHLLHTKKKHGYRNPSSRIEDPLLKTGQCAAQFWTSHILYLQHDAEEEGNSWYLTRLFTFCCGINAPKNLANSFSQQKNCWLDFHSHHSPRWEHCSWPWPTFSLTSSFPQKTGLQTPEVPAGNLPPAMAIIYLQWMGATLKMILFWWNR